MSTSLSTIIDTIITWSLSPEEKAKLLKELMNSPTTPAPKASAESIARAVVSKKKKGSGANKGGPPISKDPEVAKRMVKNNAGGYAFSADLMTRFLRFLIIGSESTYYASGGKVTLDSVKCLQTIIEQNHGKEALELLVNVSLEGRATNQDATMLALAILTSATDDELRKAAFTYIHKICRIPTHLISFINFRKVVGAGWGSGFRKAGCRFFTTKTKTPETLANQFTKYQTRDGWAACDLLRMFHPDPPTAAHNLCFDYACRKEAALAGVVPSTATPPRKQKKMRQDESYKKVHAFLTAVEQAKTATIPDLCKLISKFRLSREHIPTPMLNHAEVWNALLVNMPCTAMIRNLATMSTKGVFDDDAMVKLVVDKLTNQEILHKARVHPMTVFFAWRTYSSGHGFRGGNVWNVNKKIADTLIDKTFKLCYKNVKPSGKRILVALDISSSMGTMILGNDQVSCRDAMIAEALVIAATEPDAVYLTFSTNATVVKFDASTTFAQACHTISCLDMGGTDCALPWIWALKNDISVDAVVVYTDSETWASGSLDFSWRTAPRDVHASGLAVCDAMNKFRKQMKKPNAAMIVVGMATNDFTIADPNDPWMMDRVGCDPNGLVIQNELLQGNLIVHA